MVGPQEANINYVFNKSIIIRSFSAYIYIDQLYKRGDANKQYMVYEACVFRNCYIYLCTYFRPNILFNSIFLLIWKIPIDLVMWAMIYQEDEHFGIVGCIKCWERLIFVLRLERWYWKSRKEGGYSTSWSCMNADSCLAELIHIRASFLYQEINYYMTSRW